MKKWRELSRKVYSKTSAVSLHTRRVRLSGLGGPAREESLGHGGSRWSELSFFESSGFFVLPSLNIELCLSMLVSVAEKQEKAVSEGSGPCQIYDQLIEKLFGKLNATLHAS